MDEQEIKKSLRASKIVLVITMTGFLVFVIFFTMSILKLHALEKRIAEKEKQADHLSETVTTLAATIDTLWYASSENFRASVVTVYQTNDPAGPLYDFSLWLDKPSRHGKLIKSISYTSDHPFLRDVVATEPTNGFNVNFRAAKCISDIKITIEYQDATTERTSFDLCEALAMNHSRPEI
ncbi:hypothetical protein JXA70_03550 [candidate division KSB1 bacterium]|nr:hypothetical protein [candidate division KSB1 bacterium]